MIGSNGGAWPGIENGITRFLIRRHEFSRASAVSGGKVQMHRSCDRAKRLSCPGKLGMPPMQEMVYVGRLFRVFGMRIYRWPGFVVGTAFPLERRRRDIEQIEQGVEFSVVHHGKRPAQIIAQTFQLQIMACGIDEMLVRRDSRPPGFAAAGERAGRSVHFGYTLKVNKFPISASPKTPGRLCAQRSSFSGVCWDLRTCFVQNSGVCNLNQPKSNHLLLPAPAQDKR